MAAVAEVTKTNNKPPTMLLAELYVMTHDQMKQNPLDVCSNDHSPKPVLGAFEWTPHNWRAPDALLLQTACCYEQRGTGKENRILRKSRI
ncbi:hypothetical protein FO519_010902 [Halicephalobus sp. NKZ332]|nr:hypothetical protein FO519_010936 [Halicephalobus sp. NKZ332]KAE9545886.1 hypothetical protein FO519_010902 [Halicephalobus sp. NKZ332]